MVYSNLDIWNKRLGCDWMGTHCNLFSTSNLVHLETSLMKNHVYDRFILCK